MVIGPEVERLARNSPEWHHLLYICTGNATMGPVVAAQAAFLATAVLWRAITRLPPGRGP